MLKSTVILFASVIVIIACNNSSDNKTETTDTTTSAMTADTTHHMATTGAVPELPAIPEGAKVYFKNLKNGATVSSPLKVEFGLGNIKIDTAGPVVANSGHHHLFIDAEDSLVAGTVIPKDSAHIHFGKGQTHVDSLKLSPGKHKLTLQFADGLHRSYGSKLATTINVKVKK
jgi:Domain of unknown function (DUF4399)